MKRFLPIIVAFLIPNYVIAQKIYFSNVDQTMPNYPISNEKEKSESMKAAFSFNRLLGKELVMSKIKDHIDSEIQINYHLYLNTFQKIDSVTIYTNKMEFSRIEDRITKFEYIKIELDDFQKGYLLSVFSKVITQYKPRINYLKAIKVSGGVSTNRLVVKKNQSVSEYLATVDKKAKKIDLSGYGLTAIPKEVNEFKNIETLDLSKNLISELKFNPSQFKNLKTLNLSDNYLSEKTLQIKKNKNLRVLNLSDNSFSLLNRKWTQNRGLKDLLLANNQINTFTSRNVKRLKSVEMLNLYNCYIDELPAKINQLKKLSILDLYHNNLKQLPKGLTSLNQLQTLAISNNQLWFLPSDMNKMNNLKNLYVHHNKLDKLESLPPNLEILDLGYNLFQSIPTAIVDCQKLEQLDLSNNKINDNLEVLEKLPNLKTLYWGKNPWVNDETKLKELDLIFTRLKERNIMVK
jgi:Leucine-rich repeat (LRR) protein